MAVLPTHVPASQDVIVQRKYDTGFTLLELLVALAIALAAGTVLMSAMGGSLRITSDAARRMDALVRAESRLAEALEADDLKSGTWQGDDGTGYAWRIDVVPLRAAVPMQTSRSEQTPRRIALYRVTATIRWQDRRSVRTVTLSTEQVGSL